MSVDWGILGTGTIANIFAGEFKYVDSANLVAVASRTKENADEFADKYGLKKAYESYEALVKDKDIDVIYIATPHSNHYENTMLCLENNKSVLCEKPMAVNEKQAQEMFAKAKENDLYLMEALWTYFLLVIQKVQKWVNDGKIGEIQLIKAQVGILPKPPKNPKGRLFNPELAGGALLDTGIYPIALANLLLPNEPNDLRILSHIGDTGIDEHDCFTLTYEDGSMAQLTCSIQALMETDAYIYGTKGKIHLPEFLRTSKAVMENEEGRTVYEDCRESIGYNYEIEAVSQDVNDGKLTNDIVSPQVTLENIRVIDRARKKIGLKYPFEK